MRNLCFNRFTLRTEHAATRRKILRLMAVNYRIYESNLAENEISGRFISRRPFPQFIVRFRTPMQEEFARTHFQAEIVF